MRFIATTRRAGLVALVVILGGCGVTSSMEAVASDAPSALPTGAAPAPGQPLDACRVLTDGEIEAATGYQVVKSETFPGRISRSGCLWDFDTADPEHNGDLAFDVGHGGQVRYDSVLAWYARDGKRVPVAIPGFGDEAVLIEPGFILAIKGEAIVAVAYSGIEDEVIADLVELVFDRI